MPNFRNLTTLIFIPTTQRMRPGLFLRWLGGRLDAFSRYSKTCHKFLNRDLKGLCDTQEHGNRDSIALFYPLYLGQMEPMMDD